MYAAAGRLAVWLSGGAELRGFAAVGPIPTVAFVSDVMIERDEVVIRRGCCRVNVMWFKSNPPSANEADETNTHTPDAAARWHARASKQRATNSAVLFPGERVRKM